MVFILLFVSSAVIIPGLWKNLDKLQQTFLVTEPKIAVEHCLELELFKRVFSGAV